jgi:hypothetical protein
VNNCGSRDIETKKKKDGAQKRKGRREEKKRREEKRRGVLLPFYVVLTPVTIKKTITLSTGTSS